MPNLPHIFDREFGDKRAAVRYDRHHALSLKLPKGVPHWWDKAYREAASKRLLTQRGAGRIWEKVAQLTEALTKDDAAETRERVRVLVEAVVLVPENGRLQIEVRGELAAILSLCAESKRPTPAFRGGLLCSVSN